MSYRVEGRGGEADLLEESINIVIIIFLHT